MFARGVEVPECRAVVVREGRGSGACDEADEDGAAAAARFCSITGEKRMVWLETWRSWGLRWGLASIMRALVAWEIAP